MVSVLVGCRDGLEGVDKSVRGKMVEKDDAGGRNPRRQVCIAQIRRKQGHRLYLGELHLPHLPFLSKGPPAHLQDHLEALATPGGVLLEALDGELLDAILDLLPTTTHRDNFGVLLEGGLVVGGGGARLVDDRLANRQQVGPSHVYASHGDLLLLRVDIGGFVDVRHLLTAEERGEPFRGGLLASDEALCTELELRLSARAIQK